MRGQDEKEEKEEEEEEQAVESSLMAKCVIAASPTQTSIQMRGGVRKYNFSVWLLTDSLRRFLLGCGVGYLPSPARDRLARISEFRCCLGNSPGEEVASNASAWGTWGLGFQDMEVTSRTLQRV